MKSPQITTFQWDSSFLKVVPIFLPLAFLTFFPGPTSLFPSLTSALNGTVLPSVEYVRSAYMTQTVLTYLWAIYFGVHALESLYTLHLCRKHKTPLVPTVSDFLPTWLFHIWRTNTRMVGGFFC
jgi:hypothetical protein